MLKFFKFSPLKFNPNPNNHKNSIFCVSKVKLCQIWYGEDPTEFAGLTQNQNKMGKTLNEFIQLNIFPKTRMLSIVSKVAQTLG
jgi:hypothetical protein